MSSNAIHDLACATQRLDDLKRFYSSLALLEERLGGARRLSDCTGRMKWPARGIYFFMEAGEVRADTGNGPRIVRIGTHALKAGSKTKLWTRLKQHKGTVRTGGGNHRGSIFRRIVGAALSERDGLNYPSWGKGDSAPREVRKLEQPLERTVSTVIGDMPFIWLAVEDEPGPESLRGYIERNAIALLGNYGKHPIDPPLLRGSGILVTGKKYGPPACGTRTTSMKTTTRLFSTFWRA